MSHISRFGNLYHRRSQKRQNNKNNSFFSKIIIFFAEKYAKCYRLIHFSPLFHFLTTLSKIESLFNPSLCSRYRSTFFFFFFFSFENNPPIDNTLHYRQLRFPNRRIVHFLVYFKEPRSSQLFNIPFIE